MSNIKKISMMICSLLLLVTGFFFVGCGKKDYSNITLTASENNVVLEVGEEKSITLQINNFEKDMNGELNIRTLNTSQCISFEQNYNGDGKTTVSLTGIAGGNTQLTAVTIDGGKECTININVKEYSNTFQNNDDKLYVSESFRLSPSSANFKFDETSTERELRYFFFGRLSADDAQPSLDMVTDGDGNYFNEFDNVNVIEKDEEFYLLFNKGAEYFTLKDESFDASRNTFYKFMSVEVVENNGEFIYNFLPESPDDVAKTISLGEKLNFFAFYESAYLKDGNIENLNKYLLLRDFNILTDIKDVSYGYHYLRYDQNYLNAPIYSNDKLILIPNREVEENNSLTYYKSVIFKVTVPGNSELINADYASNSNLNILRLNRESSQTSTTFTYQVSSNSVSAVEFDFNLHVFYEGYQNADDMSVNYQISVPVVIKSQPNSLSVNNYEEGERTYTFYNNYSGNSIGWQEFKLLVLPSDASYKNAVIRFNKDEILVKYKNNTYSQGLLTIEDISAPIYFKGASTTDKTEKVGKIEISLVYNAIVDESLSYNIDYRIVAGAKSINFEEPAYEFEGLYLPLDQTQRTFSGLFADASYQDVTFTLLEGDDVVALNADLDNIIGENSKYPIKFNVTSKKYGEGKYKVSLDNGISKEIKFKVIETLDDISMSVDGDSKGVTYFKHTPAMAEGENAEGEIYLRNSSASEFDGNAKIKLMANGNADSAAITGASYVKHNAECLSLTDTITSTVNVNITTNSIGNGTIRYTISGYSVDENFTRQTKTIIYVVTVVSYNLINDLTINKIQDGDGIFDATSAAYVKVYHNTLSEEKRTAKFDFTTQSSGYLFYEPAGNAEGEGQFVAGSLDKRYISWTSSASNEIMYYKDGASNLYTIPEIGTFNTDTLTFIGYNRPYTLNLVATIRQYDRPYSFTIKIETKEYEKVQNISVQNYDSQQGLNFSLNKQTIDLVVHVTPRNATVRDLYVEVSKNSNIEVSGGDVNTKEIQTIYLFGDAKPGEPNSGISIRDVGNGSSIITLSIAKFLASASDEVKNSQFEISSTIRIASADWVSGESISDEFLSRAIVINCNYTNGTQANPYSIETSQDLLNISKNLSAHYKLGTNINLTDSEAQSLPLGAFSGSLVGTNDYAQISGIKIDSKANQQSFGLFTSNSGTIKNIQFSGKIDTSSTISSFEEDLGVVNTFYIGLVAGVNTGLIQNISVNIDQGTIITDKGIFNIGGIVGQNNGSIIVDQTKLIEEYDNHGEAVFSKILDANNNLISYQTINQSGIVIFKLANETNKIVKTWGRTSPSVLSNFNGALLIEATEKSTMNVGGVAGINGSVNDQNKTAKIEKIDDKNITKYGYSNYIVFANIEISKSLGKEFGVNAGGVAGMSHGKIFGGQATSFTTDSLGKVSTVYDTTYKIGSGILAGGKVVDLSLQGAIAGSNDYNQNLGGIVGRYKYNSAVVDLENGIGNVFFGATSRVNVVGSLNVGGIAGDIDLVLSDEGREYIRHFALQAIDNGGIGLSSALVTRVGYQNKIVSGINKANDIAFAERNGLDYGFMKNEANATDNNLLSYVNRSYISVGKVLPSLDSEYAGDYIEVTKGDINNGEDVKAYYVRNQVKFADASTSLNVSANKGFSVFETDDASGDTQSTAAKMFYMYYFNSLGYVYSSTEQDITQAQEELDKQYNNILTSNELYPIILSDDTTITSMNPEVLTIDKNGTINVFKTGLAKLNLSSILDVKNTITIYLNVVNYFSNNQTSIIYPSAAKDATPIENTSIQLKGQSSVTLYIIPSTTSITENLVSDKGVVTLNGNNIQIKNNEEISSHVSVFKSKPVYDENGKVTNTDCVYDNSENFIVNKEEINVTVSGQTIAFARNSSTEEEKSYYVLFTPILKVDVRENLTSYICYVNKKLDNVDVTYIKGAESIKVEYDSKVISTSTVGKDIISISSSKQENQPYYAILRNGNTLFCNLPGLESGLYFEDIDGSFYNNSVLNIDFEKGSVNEINSLYSNYEYNISYSVNKNSPQYIDRYNESIYGNYEVIFYASTNTAKFVSVNVVIERFFVNNISVDNYQDINGIYDFSGANNIGVPGKYGLLAITLTPEDCDFDYITIENDALNNASGNGYANFSLVRKNEAGNTEFTEVNISGSTTNKGIKLKYEDILKAYNVEKIEPYHGVIYIKYVIGTKNVLDSGISKFNIVLNGENEVPALASKTLNLKLDYHAYVDVVGKTPVDMGQDKVHATYLLARGMKYELSIDDRWGFAFENVKLKSTNPEVGQVVLENGKYYLQITENTIDYNNFTSFDIEVQAYQKEGELERTFESKTIMRVLEYVVNYNYEIAGNADIVKEMDDGVINIQIGNRQTLEVNFSSYLEYNHNINVISEQVDHFMQTMTNNGQWTVYTNLNVSGVSNNKVVSTQNYVTKSNLLATGQAESINNIYFNSVGNDITPVITHQAKTPFYVFSYKGAFAIEKGVYSYKPYEDDLQKAVSNVYTEFVVDVFQGSSAESPIPIDNYADFMKMQTGANYILLKDIRLENQPYVDVNGETIDAFKPINAKVASLDGNGYKITFAGTYDFNSLDKIGLFGIVNSSSLLKNVKVEISQNTTFITNTSAFEAGVIAGENNGAITNCEVIGGRDATLGEVYYFDVKNNDRKSNSYVAGIAGRNSGYITNSRSSVNINSYYNVAGIVGVNTNKISSSYFKGGNLICSSREGHKLSGFVNINSGENSKIMTSYVSGNTSVDDALSLDESNVLSSSGIQAGFVSTNFGVVENCYSNIQMQGSSFMSGFVDENSGTIYNSYSTSILENRVTSSFGFARGNRVTDEGQVGITGTFENCYYLYNVMSKTEEETIANGFDFNIGRDVNSSLSSVIFAGVEKLKPVEFRLPTANDFNPNNSDSQIKYQQALQNFNARFGDFGYSNLIGYNSVWFYSTGITSGNFNNVKFNKNRLELVSPNMVASSQRYLMKTSIDSSTGQINYQYAYTSTSPSQGDLKNPYIIRSAAELEFYMLSAKTSNNFNTKNYRLVADINYNDYAQLSNMYKINYCGVFEGNGMEILNIAMLSMENLDSAGMFASIGKDASAPGTVMNLTIEPKSVTFTNAVNVGTLAGTLNYGYLSNITVTRNQEEVNVVGSNFVGGIIGRTGIWFNVFNLKSDISAIAYHTSENAGESYEVSGLNTNMYSYAGSVIGYASGQNSRMQKIEVNNVSDVMAGRAGIAFGGIGFGVNASDITVNVRTDVNVTAHFYGGLVAGENRGNVSDVYVKGSGTMISPFAVVPKTPIAVGGVFGNMQSGILSNVYMGQALRIGANSNNKTINYVGGIVGATSTSNMSIENVVIDVNIQATGILGGVVGFNNAITNINQVAVKSLSLTVTGYTYSACVGGIVGRNMSSSLTITNSYSTSRIIIDIYGYSAAISSTAGGFIGDGKVLKMENCYTTSFIDVSMIDKRESGVVDDVVQFVNGNTDNTHAYRFDNQNTVSGCKDVYYLGFNGTTAQDGENAIKYNDFLNIKGLGNKNTTGSIKFKHNAIGLSSYEYEKDQRMTSGNVKEESLSVTLPSWIMPNASRHKDKLALGKKDALHGLFDFYNVYRNNGIVERLFFSKALESSQFDRYVVYRTDNLATGGQKNDFYQQGTGGGAFKPFVGANQTSTGNLNFNDPNLPNYIEKDDKIWTGGKGMLPVLSFENLLLKNAKG